MDGLYGHDTTDRLLHHHDHDHHQQLFFWVSPRSRLAAWLRRPWNPQTFDECVFCLPSAHHRTHPTYPTVPSSPTPTYNRLVAREFEVRDHPPVLAIIGPLPWFAPTFLTNDAAVITELVRRSNRRLQGPRLVARSNSSGNLTVRGFGIGLV